MVKKDIITIFNVDSLLGYAIAFRFLESKRKHTTIRLVCHEKDGLEKLEDLGGKLIKTDYNDENKINEALDGTWLLLVVPEYSEKRFEYGNLVLSRAKDLNVNYVVLFSYIGVESLTHDEAKKSFKNLQEYHDLEKKMCALYDKESYCIIRIGFLNQLFYYMGPMLEDKNQMRLSVYENSEWSTIDLGDVVDATYNLCFTDTYSGSSGDRKNKTLFTLAADDTVTAKDVVCSANEALHKDMTYDRVNPKDLVTYLQKIRKDNRFKRRPFEQLELLKKDHPYTFPLGKYLTDTNIETLVEWWRLADDGKTNVTSDDLRRALGCPPQNIDLFFKQNSDQFRLLR